MSLEKITPTDRYAVRDNLINVPELTRGMQALPGVLKQLGFTNVRKGQDSAIAAIMGWQDLLVVMNTAAGKSAVFIIPTLAMGWRTLVFSPLIALMNDQVHGLLKKGIAAGQINGNRSLGENDFTIKQWMQGKLQMLYVAPERLSNESFISALNTCKPDMVVVDETHCLSNWSDTFRPAYCKIGDYITAANPKVVAAFTATCPPEVEEDVRRVLCMSKAKKLSHYMRRDNLDFTTQEYTGINQIVDIINATKGAVIVYCSTINRLEETAAQLQRALSDKVLTIYHGQMDAARKEASMRQFMDGKADVCVATNAFGMGVDKSDVRAVIHRDIPGNIEALAQELGRCVHPDSWVSTNAGLKLASEVVLGDIMPMFDFISHSSRTAHVAKTVRNTTDKLIVLRTKLGSTLRITHAHPCYKLDSEGCLVELPANALRLGDKVPATRGIKFAERSWSLIDLISDCPEPIFVGLKTALIERWRAVLSVQRLGELLGLARAYDYTCFKGAKKACMLSRALAVNAAVGISASEFLENILFFKTNSSRRITLPAEVTADLAWLAGIWATDGYLQHAKPSIAHGYGAWQGKLGSVDERILNKAQKIIQAFGLKVCRQHRTRCSKLSKQPFGLVEFSSPVLLHLLGKLGIPSGKKSYTVRVGLPILQGTDEIKAAYLAGVVDGDGSLAELRNSVRVHSASWDFISDVAMLFRSIGIVGSVRREDYLCKRHVMTTQSDYGLTLDITSLDHVMAAQKLLSPFAAKTWKFESDVAHTPQQKSRRKKIWVGSDYWLEDEVIDICSEVYNGPVLNWNITPGNQLIVNCVLTHNCGRDGKPARGITLYAADSLRTQRQFLDNGHPSRSEVEKFFYAVKSMVDPKTMTVSASAETLEKMSGVHKFAHRAVRSILLGANVLATVPLTQKICTIKFTGSSEDSGFRKYREAVLGVGQVLKDGSIECDVENLADQLLVTDATVTKNLKTMAEKGLLVYSPPPRITPLKVIGDISAVDFGRLALRRKQCEIKLQQVIDYQFVPDHERHAYIEKCFGH